MKNLKIAEKALIILLFLFQSQNKCLAQKWVIKNPITKTNKMLVVKDGIYVVGSNDSNYKTKATFNKYNFLGVKQFQTSFSDTTFWQTSEIKSIDTISGTNDIAFLAIATLGSTNTFILVRADSSVNIIWKRKFSKSYIDNKMIVNASSLPGKIITLTADTIGQLEYNLWDSAGNNILYKPLFLDIHISSFFIQKPITKIFDGYLILYGGTTIPENGFVKIDFLGNTKWIKSYEWYTNPIPISFKSGEIGMFYFKSPDGVYYYFYNDILSINGDYITTNNIKLQTGIQDIQTTSNNDILVSGTINFGSTRGNQISYGCISLLDSNYQNPQIYENKQYSSIDQFYKNDNSWIGLSRYSTDKFLFSDSVSFIPYVYTLGINEIIDSDKVKLTIYPNPTTNELHIETTGSEKFDVQIFDINGKQVLGNILFTQTVSINIESLWGGIYFMKIIDASGAVVKTQKVAVVK